MAGAIVGTVSLTAKEMAELAAKNARIRAEAQAATDKAIAESNVKPSASAADELKKINDQVKLLADQALLSNSGKVVSYEKESHDVTVDNNMTARDIGFLRKNNSRLNLFSALEKGDKVDVFKFRVTNAGDVKMGTLIADPTDKELIRIQLFSKSSGLLIADQDPKSGQSFKNFEALQAGTFELRPDEYAVRVSRMPGKDVRAEDDVQYVIQFTQGLYRNDFDTVEKGVSKDQDAFGKPLTLGASTEGLLSLLGSSSSFISNLPPIGTSATSKLTGAMYDALF